MSSGQPIADLRLQVTTNIGKALTDFVSLEQAGKSAGTAIGAGLRNATADVRAFDQALDRANKRVVFCFLVRHRCISNLAFPFLDFSKRVEQGHSSFEHLSLDICRNSSAVYIFGRQ